MQRFQGGLGGIWVTGGEREGERVEDEVARLEVKLFNGHLVNSLGDLQFFPGGLGHPVFIDGQADQGGVELAGQAEELGSFLFTFAGGARWLLLLLPTSWLNRISQSINLVNSGFDTAPTLIEALHKTWVIEGGGPVPFPFAFHNGIFVPVFFNLGSTGALPFMTIFLLLLLLPRGRFSTTSLIIWSLLFATLALSAEHFFAVIWVGIMLAIVFSLIFRKRLHSSISKVAPIQWGIILLVSALFAVVQGGFVTEAVRKIINSFTGAAGQSYYLHTFLLRWPPGLPSAHLGALSIFNPTQLIALLTELGPALLIIPIAFLRFNKDLKYGNLFSIGLALSVVFSLVLPLFFQYQIDRQITRILATGLWTALVLGFPILWMALPRLNAPARIGLALGFFVCILGGVVIFRIQLFSINSPQYAYYIDGLDAGYTVDYWNKLSPGAQVLDRVPERSVTIFGRITRAYSGIYDPLPDWEALIADPNPNQIAAAGFDYVYMDNVWLTSLTAVQQANFLQPCIDIIDDREQDIGTKYRLLVDVRACR